MPRCFSLFLIHKENIINILFLMCIINIINNINNYIVIHNFYYLQTIKGVVKIVYLSPHFCVP